MSRYARHTDENHRLVVNTLRAFGCTVEAIQGSTGTPDLLVGIFGLTELVEVKPDVGETRRRERRESQVEWAARWKGGKPVVVRTVQDCEALVSRLRGQLTRNEVHADIRRDDKARPRVEVSIQPAAPTGEAP